MSVNVKSATVSGITPVYLSEDSHPSFIEGYMLDDPSVCDGLIQFIDSPRAIVTGETVKGVFGGRDGKLICDKKIKKIRRCI